VFAWPIFGFSGFMGESLICLQLAWMWKRQCRFVRSRLSLLCAFNKNVLLFQQLPNAAVNKFAGRGLLLQFVIVLVSFFFGFFELLDFANCRQWECSLQALCFFGGSIAVSFLFRKNYAVNAACVIAHLIVAIGVLRWDLGPRGMLHMSFDHILAHTTQSLHI